MHYLLIIPAILLLVQPSTSARGLYLQVYPDRGASNGTKHLYFGLMQSFGGGYNGSGTIPGVQVALDQINMDPSILPGYTLHYTLSECQCDRRTALDGFFGQILGDPSITKIAWLGSGCSPATEPTAEISHYYNITQVSGISSSPELSNREVFKYYFQLLPPDDDLALGFFAIIRKFNWKYVAIIQQDENIFTVTMERLKALLDAVNVSYSERFFETNKGVAELGSTLFDDTARIFILSMYEAHARDVLCEAYLHNIQYPTHLLVTYMYTWYSAREWWNLDNRTHKCTPEERASVMRYVLGPTQFEFISNYSTVPATGINGSQFNTSYFEHLKKSPLGLQQRFEGYSVYCYDTTWTIAYALNKTLTDLLTNDTLRRMAGEEAGLEDPDGFGLENFTYRNSIIAETMFKHLESTHFTGLTGHVSFDHNGIRKEGVVLIRQFRYNETLEKLVLHDIGRGTGTGENLTFEYTNGWTEQTIWQDGLIPYDGVPIEMTETVELPLTVLYSLLATAGIIFAIICLVFNFHFRKQKMIRLTSPNLNYLIIAGTILLYVDVYLTVVPRKDKDTVTVLCNTIPLFTSVGYSLCFGTMVAKMMRVFYIFKHPSVARKTSILPDWKLALGVLVLVTVDLVILVVYTIVEGVGGNLEADRVEHKENPMDTIGEQERHHNYYVYVCNSKSQYITLGILYGYKGVLQVASLVFAFLIRKIQVKGLNNAMYIVGAIYVTSIMLLIAILSTYLPALAGHHINYFAALFGLGLLVGATVILLLVFVPKMVSLHKDPKGEKVFTTHHQHNIRSVTQMADPPAVRATPASNQDSIVDTLRRRILELETVLSRSQTQASATNETD